MNNFRLRAFCLIFSVIFLTVVGEFVYAEEEDTTAHLTFKKSATSKTKTRPYVVKKGEWLFDILRTQVGITSKQYIILKKLNPHIKDFDKVEPGDVITLPDIESPSTAKMDDVSTETGYTVRKGDSISRIAMRHLQTRKKSEIIKTVNIIKRLNPNIKNYNLIYPGQMLELPRRGIVLTKEEATASESGYWDKFLNGFKKEKSVVLPETRLAIIRHIITGLNGSLVTTGKYYVPIPQFGEVTVDCSKIPVVELDDGNTILLDFADQIPDTLKNMIQTSWKNYHSIKIGNDEGTAATLQKIINVSSTYAMTKMTAPYIIGSNPPLQLFIDWIITKKSAEGTPYLRGLSFVSGNSQLLPNPVLTYAVKNGLTITEIIDGQGIMYAPDEKYTSPHMLVLNSSTTIELIGALLNELGYPTVKDTQIEIFDTAQQGYNVSIKADLLVKKNNKQIIIVSKPIPQQFIDNLKKRNIEAVSFNTEETRKSVISKVLQSINIPFSFNSFAFPVPAKTNYPKGVINFPAFKIDREKGQFYLIDFEMDRDIYGLLHDRWGVNIVKY